MLVWWELDAGTDEPIELEFADGDRPADQEEIQHDKECAYQAYSQGVSPSSSDRKSVV